MPRAALPTILVLVVLTGCLGPAADTVTDPRPTTDASPTSTPHPDEFVPFPDGPKDRPDLPTTLTAESASDYAIAHEFRYSYNELWEGPDTEVGMSEHSCSVESTGERGSGYLVTVECSGYVNRPVDDESTATEHADLPPWTVRYYVDGDSVLRTELE